MADMNLSKHENNGLELYVDEATGLAYAHQEAMRRMFGLESKGGTLTRRLASISVDDKIPAEILTDAGIRSISLYPARVVAKLAIEFKPELAEKMIEAGANVYMLGLAGYHVQATKSQLERQFKKVDQSRPRPLTNKQISGFISEYSKLKKENPSAANAYTHLMAIADPRYTDLAEPLLKLIPAEVELKDEHHPVSYYAKQAGISAKRLNKMLIEWGVQTSERDHKSKLIYHPTAQYEHLAYLNEDQRSTDGKLRPQLEWKIGLKDVVAELYVA